MAIVSYHFAVLEISSFLGLTESNRDDLPSFVILRVCKVLIFIQRGQHILVVNDVKDQFVRFQRLCSVFVISEAFFDLLRTEVKKFYLFLFFSLSLVNKF